MLFKSFIKNQEATLRRILERKRILEMFDEENMQAQQRKNKHLFTAFFNEYFNVSFKYYS